MRLDGIAGAAVGSRRAVRVMYGGTRMWPATVPFLELSPDRIWLLRSNDWTEYVELLSNVTWDVK